MLTLGKPRIRAEVIKMLLEALCILVCAAILIDSFLQKPQAPRPPRTQTSDISNIKTQISVFQIDNGRYPTTAEGLKILVENPGNMPGWTHAYLDKMPVDPWGRPYVYRCPGTNGADFDFYSMGSDGIDGTADDIGDTNRR
jgi:general secretion pathway protein G